MDRYASQPAGDRDRGPARGARGGPAAAAGARQRGRGHPRPGPVLGAVPPCRGGAARACTPGSAATSRTCARTPATTC
ncbi:hypothetical protein [Nocardioides convexus]|uniref:hypothetical protein n=1 Tax=Nocardioides convexus TaxID=2712224 RepID=UPI0024189C68|nr:hypothetical protein [Nocardioides convexus]